MAAAESMGLNFVDEDDLPVAFLRITHVDSDNEAPSDVNSRDEEEGESDGEIDNSDEEKQKYSNMRWTSVLQPPEGVNFREEVGMRVEMDNDSNCLDYFQPLFLLMMFISWFYVRPNGLSIKNGSLRTILWVISTILPFQS